MSSLSLAVVLPRAEPEILSVLQTAVETSREAEGFKMNNETSLVIPPDKNQVVVCKGGEIEVTAQSPDEFSTANNALIEWCRQKVDAVQKDATELREAYELAVKNKWRTVTLKRHAELAAKRVAFYKKIQTALEMGFVIVPNFPVTVFAIRTEKNKPLKMATFDSWNSNEQHSTALDAGAGEYKNPFPVMHQRALPTENKPNQKEYYSHHWDEMEFPLQMSKPNIMETCNRAMALKLFDDLGVLPGKTKVDPIIVARLADPRSTKYNRRFVSFIIAWHLDTRTL